MNKNHILSIMKEIYTEIEINSSAEEVWNILINFANYPNWNPFMKQIPIGDPCPWRPLPRGRRDAALPKLNNKNSPKPCPSVPLSPLAFPRFIALLLPPRRSLNMFHFRACACAIFSAIYRSGPSLLSWWRSVSTMDILQAGSPNGTSGQSPISSSRPWRVARYSSSLLSQPFMRRNCSGVNKTPISAGSMMLCPCVSRLTGSPA